MMIFNTSWKDLLIAWLETIWEARPEIFKSSFWVTPFPQEYHPKCFDCHLGPEDCPECEFRQWEI